MIGVGIDDTLADLVHVGGAVGTQAVLGVGTSGCERYCASSRRPEERRSSIKRHRSEQ